MVVYQVQYDHPDPGSDEDAIETFHIGVYSSRALADEAVERLRKQPGFADEPDGFTINETLLDLTYWQDGFIRADPPDSS